MNVFCDCLKEQLVLHPSMQPRDVVKLCYQAACGAEHLLSDSEAARVYFEEEFQSVDPADGALFERISDNVCRVNLSVWKQRNLPSDRLFRMFARTVFSVGGKQRLMDYLDAAEQVLMTHSFDMDAWRLFLTQYKEDGMPAVRHSEIYRGAEHPAYRIVDAVYLPLLQALERAETTEEALCAMDTYGKTLL